MQWKKCYYNGSSIYTHTTSRIGFVEMKYEVLENTMIALVQILREILATMEEEQHALLVQNAPAFQLIMQKRTPLVDSMHTCRQTMLKEIDQLKDMHPEISAVDSEREKLMNLALLAGEDNVELLTLRDQILALTDKLEKQNASNNTLLDNRVLDVVAEKENYTHQYKPVRRRMQPRKSPAPVKKPVVKTLEIGEKL